MTSTSSISSCTGLEARACRPRKRSTGGRPTLTPWSRRSRASLGWRAGRRPLLGDARLRRGTDQILVIGRSTVIYRDRVFHGDACYIFDGGVAAAVQNRWHHFGILAPTLTRMAMGSVLPGSALIVGFAVPIRAGRTGAARLSTLSIRAGAFTKVSIPTTLRTPAASPHTSTPWPPPSRGCRREVPGSTACTGQIGRAGSPGGTRSIGFSGWRDRRAVGPARASRGDGSGDR